MSHHRPALNVIPSDPRQIALISQARRMLAEARTIDEVKDIRDKAEAMRRYLQQRDESLEARNIAAEIKLWAERKAGEMLKETPKRHGARPADTESHDVTPLSTLADQGISKMESSRWQAIASLPEEEFKEHLEGTKEAGEELTTNGVLKEARERKARERRERKEADLEAGAKTAPASDLWRIIHGDCIEVMRSLPPGSARLVFADPPYNEGVNYGKGAGTDRLPDGQYLGWCREWMSTAVDLLRDDGSLWVLISKDYADDFGVILRRDLGLHRRDWIVWYETFGVNCTGKFNRCSRHLFHMTRSERRFVFNKDAVRRESDRQAKYGDRRANPDGKLWDDVWTIPRLVGTATERIPGFPTQLPLTLLRAVVGCASDPGDLVLDPFSGSATTGEAAIRLGRRYLGIEKGGRFVDLSRMRLRAIPGADTETARDGTEA